MESKENYIPVIIILHTFFYVFYIYTYMYVYNYIII